MPQRNSPDSPRSGTRREKTRPTRPLSGTRRENNRPAQQKPSVLDRFGRAGRKISRFLRTHSTQGEFFRAVGATSWFDATNGTAPTHDKPQPKPLAPLRGANRSSLKPRAPLHAEIHLNSAIFRPQWYQWFHSSMIAGQQKCHRFHLRSSAASKASSVLCSAHLPH